MKYVELHCHSNFSFLQGASHPEELVERALDSGYHALAITDVNGLYSAVRFHQACIRHGIKPIIGAEVILDDNSHIVLLVKNKYGYANLSTLLSTSQLRSKKGEAKTSLQSLENSVDGLIALSGNCFHNTLLRHDQSDARNKAAYLNELFGAGNFYLELVHHNLPAHEFLVAQLTNVGKQLGIPTVATNDVYFAFPERRILQDVLTCIKHHTTIDEADNLLYPNAERYLKTSRQMARRFVSYPEAIEQTVHIAQQCEFNLSDLQTSLPDFKIPPGETAYSYLRKLTYDGASRRYPEMTSDVHRQLEHELSVIHRLNFSGYFLIVYDIAQFCRERGILCQGRGSAANSAVCYCLEITAVDPIKLDLLFERFISEERRDPPDIDMDIANDRREEAIQYVYERYGREHAAMVCEVISYRGRSAVRDVGKALGFSLEDVNMLSKLLDRFADFQEFCHRIEEVKLNSSSTRVRLFVEILQQIRSFPRHLGIHVGGMLISKRPLSELVPIENATMPLRSVIQWDKDDTSDVGLAKIDLLGLGMLTMISMGITLVKDRHGIQIDMAQLSYDDPKVYDLMCDADTVGVFQVESRAQMNTLPRLRPRCFYDLVIEVALIRPGPIQGDMVHPYLRRRKGIERVTYPHPELEPVLKRTLGVPLFQEQGMKVAIIAGGFSPTQADELRRSMGHKRSRERINALSYDLIEGMRKKGYSKAATETILNQLSSFADFGFAESHAASFALLVYVSAFLKVYYPIEFYTALLNAQPMGFYSPSTIIFEAKRKGIRFLGVDVTKSGWHCQIENDGIRLGFRFVKNLGSAARDIIEHELKKGCFLSVEDFVYRTELEKDSLEQLAMIGAFDCFEKDRRRGLWKVLSIRKKPNHELKLESGSTGAHLIRRMSIKETVAADFKGMDLSTGPHPMAVLREELKERGIKSSEDLKHLPDNTEVTVAGVVTIRQRPGTAKGFVFITLEDETGFSNVVIKPNLVRPNRKVIVGSPAMIVNGILEKKEGVINVMGSTFYPLCWNEQEIRLKSRDFH